MSSFDYTDNFNGFNDLINRADFLTEAKIGKAHPSFGGLAKRIKQEVGKGFPRDVRMLIKTVLYYLDIFNDEDLDTLKAAGGAATSSYRLALEGLLDKYQDEIKSRADEITDKLEEEFINFVNEQKLKVGADRKAAYEAESEAKAAAQRLEKEIEGGGDIVDAVDGAVGELEQSTADAFETLRAAKEDPTTFIEIKIRDADKASDVSNIVTKYANEDGVEVSGNTVQFSVDPDTPLANAVSTHGVDKIEAALKRDVDAISDSVVVVMAPEEDYERMDDEEMGYGLDEPGGVPGSYAMGEEGGGITEVEDAEDLSAKKARAGKDIGKPGKNFSKIAKSAGKKYGSKAAGERVAGAVLAKMRGNYEGEEDGITQKPYISMYKDDEGRTVYDVLDKHGKSAYKSYYKKVAEHWLREYYDIMMMEDEEDNELDHFLTKEQPEDYIPSTDYEDVLDALVDDDKKKHAMKKLGSEDEESILSKIEQDISNGMTVKESMDSLGIHPSHQKDMLHKYLAYTKEYSEGPVETGFENEEEAIKMQPMLESHKTNTSVYLTEQAASDKRNKKTETKNQSFKEKYKPKTSWQLEELRRYGL